MPGKRKHHDIPDEIPREIIVTDILDLHGFFPEQVPDMVEAFLQNALDLGLKQVRIVHGKGKSKMKWEVYQVLKNHAHVIRFGDASADSGGWGSTKIELEVRPIHS
jgi:DNA-nicking Smr family endonuclease